MNLCLSFSRFRHLCLATAVAASLPAADCSDRPIRFGYMRSLLRNANENDFRSAMRAYTMLLAEHGGYKLSNDHLLFESVDEMARALATDTVDIAGGAAAEVLELPEHLVEPPFLSATVGTDPGVHYVLLVTLDGGVRALTDLAGRRIAVIDNSYGSLARTWLEQVLREAGLGPAATHFGEVKPVGKATLAALPVFFGQLDACIVTAGNFATLSELNPQLARKLRPLVTSPRLVPILSAFRRGMDPALRAAVSRTMSSVDQTPTGRQLLTLFQTDSLRFCTEAELAPTRQLVAGRHKATAERPSPAHRPAPP